MSEPNELEQLTDFLHSEGWRLFGEHCQREWGPSGLRFQSSVRDAAAQKEGGAQQLQLVLRVQEELIALLSYPKARVEQLKNQQQAALVGPSMSRRGPGL